MMVLVSYDVSTRDEAGKRRLRRVARACENLGQRVQNSVFECLVDPAQWVALRARLLSEADPAQDSLRFYFFGGGVEAPGGTFGREDGLRPRGPAGRVRA